MISFGDFIWNCRIEEYCEKVFKPVFYWEDEKKKNRQYAANLRKFINRCEKVGWTKMDEIKNLSGWDVKSYIKQHEDLFIKLWDLEFPKKKLFIFQ